MSSERRRAILEIDEAAGWKSISDLVGLSINQTRRLAALDGPDRLPVHRLPGVSRGGERVEGIPVLAVEDYKAWRERARSADRPPRPQAGEPIAGPRLATPYDEKLDAMLAQLLGRIADLEKRLPEPAPTRRRARQRKATTRRR